MTKKTIPNSIIFLMSLGIDVWVEFGGFVVPKWSQVATKMGSKIDFSENMKKRIWNWPANAKLLSGGPSWEQKSIQNRSKNGFQDGMHLGTDFVSILVVFGNQVGMENPPKSIQKGIQKTMQNPPKSDHPDSTPPYRDSARRSLRPTPPFRPYLSSGGWQDAPGSIFEIPSLSLRS